MKYTSEVYINKRCAELMGIDLFNSYKHSFNKNKLMNKHMDKGAKRHHLPESEECFFTKVYNNPTSYLDCKYNPCQNPSDTWVIIEKCWDELSELSFMDGWVVSNKWNQLMQKHNCTKLVAACICFIEVNS